MHIPSLEDDVNYLSEINDHLYLLTVEQSSCCWWKKESFSLFWSFQVTTVKVIIQRLYIVSIQSNTIYRMKLLHGCTIAMYSQTTMDHGKKMVNSMFGYFYWSYLYGCLYLFYRVFLSRCVECLSVEELINQTRSE